MADELIRLTYRMPSMRPMKASDTWPSANAYIFMVSENPRDRRLLHLQQAELGIRQDFALATFRHESKTISHLLFQLLLSYQGSLEDAT